MNQTSFKYQIDSNVHYRIKDSWAICLYSTIYNARVLYLQI